MGAILNALKVEGNDGTGNVSIGGFIKYRRFDNSETD